jgi:2-succinyl-5-enolpyruvyl-6-hydroxy-3-cyclohexene-1-carboxylate synthase
MQIKVNRNYFWSTIFIDQLVECGVKYACISPGSRSAPITYAISQNKKIKSYVIIDERNSGFFGLGLAKFSNSPVLIVTTSGTATAELYPAIIEAYQNRVPLIICTADRPAYLKNSGANQTINQDNIYKNHIRFFFDTGLPKLDLKNINNLKSNTKIAYDICTNTNVGPVHFNLPFEKPLEPDSFTDEIKESILLESLPIENIDCNNKIDVKKNLKSINQLTELIQKNSDGLIIIGPGTFNEVFFSSIENISIKLSLPIFADASSNLKFKSKSLSNLVSNYDPILRSVNLLKSFKPKYILQFGRPLTSPRFEEFLSTIKAKHFIVNSFGDFNNQQKRSTIITMDEILFLKSLHNIEISNDASYSNKLNFIKAIDSEIENIKNEVFSISSKLNETGILLEVINSIPPNSNLMIGNSTPIRDLDFFSSAINKNINVFQNRGASGIDGITSTALGICSQSKNPTYLIIGDISFYYDINSLLIAKQNKIPLIVILINNNGGSIFRFLPISNHKTVLEKYFLTPTNLSFKKLSEAFDIDYKELKSYQDILNHIKVSSVRKTTVVYEIKSNSEYSLSVRKKYWTKVNKFVDNFLRNYEA